MDTGSQAAALPAAQAAAKSDDHIWAALAHASSVLMFLGPLVPLIIWTTQRKKSAYVSFHALQAMAYQALFFWVWVIVMPVLMIVLLAVMVVVLVVSNPSTTNEPFLVFGMQMLIFGLLFGGMLVFMAVGVVGAVLCLMGREFRYPFFGGRLARYVGYAGETGPELDEARQDHVVAAVSHATCIVLMWGLVTPIVAWLTQHDRSPFLRFQALQAAIYQAIGLVAYFGFMALYMVMSFGLLGASVVLANSRNTSAGGLLAVFMLVFFCIMGVFVLGGPLYHLFGFLASLATLRGKDYRYPILGNLLRRRMKLGEAE